MKKVVTILFLIFILSCSSYSQNLETENIDLKKQLLTLEAEYLTLEDKYLTLETEYRLLEMSINNLRKQYESSDIESSIKSKK